MNVIKKMLIGCCLGMLAMAVGCGSSSSSPATGKVVKGPVVGATVRDSTGTIIGTTDANGNFPLIGIGPYHTTGGTYIPLNPDGTAGTAVPAPPMAAPAGVSQITPLSTLFVTATPAQQAQITALLTAAGGLDLNTDMSAKLATGAANASGVNAILTINEAVGAALQQAPSAVAPAVTTALITAVTSLSPSTITTNTATVIGTAVTSSITTAAATNTALAAVSTQLTTAASNAAEGAANVLPGPLPTATTTTTTAATTTTTAAATTTTTAAATTTTTAAATTTTTAAATTTTTAATTTTTASTTTTTLPDTGGSSTGTTL